LTCRGPWKHPEVSGDRLSQHAAGSFEVRLPARAASISEARHHVREFVRSLGADSADIEVAVTEAVANAFEHGFRHAQEGTIVLRIDRLVPETLAVTVSDDGVGIGPDLESEGLGFGLALIGRLSAGFEITPLPRGTKVRMRFRLRAA
jgi:anti-sigma regulatory factor (Ser/Thr protein kinase)